MGVIEELYQALCRAGVDAVQEDDDRAQIRDELWETVSAQAGGEAAAELRRLCRAQLVEAELQGFRSGLLLGINMMSELL